MGKDNRHQSSQEIVYEKKIFKVRNSYKIKISSYVKLKLRNQIIESYFIFHIIFRMWLCIIHSTYS